MKKYFILIAMVAVSVSAADKNNASDEYYTCHMSKQLDRTSKSLGGNHFPEETETAKIKWDGSRFTVYGMNGVIISHHCYIAPRKQKWKTLPEKRALNSPMKIEKI